MQQPSASGQKTWLVVGASRGIGREFVRQLLVDGQRVIASVRTELAAMDLWPGVDGIEDRCQLSRCDMLDNSSIDNFVSSVEQLSIRHIDYVVLNAGVLKYPNRASEISYDDFAFHLHTNTIGPVITAQKLLQSTITIGSITFISSDSASATEFRDFEDGFAAYGASKAALNHMLRHLAAELKRKRSETVILAVHPGEVATDMANIDLGWTVEGQMTSQESVSAVLKVIPSKKLEDSGTFWTWENKPYPW